MRETESIDDGNRWEWLKQGELEPEIESLLCEAQTQALQVDVIRYSIDQTSDTALCRLCNEKTLSITHIVSASSIVTKSQYRKCHGKVGTYVHWLLSKNITYNVVTSGTHSHTPQSVQENDLRIESQKVWNVKVVVIPVVIGALGTISKRMH